MGTHARMHAHMHDKHARTHARTRTHVRTHPSGKAGTKTAVCEADAKPNIHHTRCAGMLTQNHTHPCRKLQSTDINLGRKILSPDPNSELRA